MTGTLFDLITDQQKKSDYELEVSRNRLSKIKHGADKK